MSVTTTTETLTAWEVWEKEDTRLYQAMLDAEQAMLDADSEYRGHDEKIAELEEELTKLRNARVRFGMRKHQGEIKLEVAKQKYRLNQELEPEQD